MTRFQAYLDGLTGVTASHLAGPSPHPSPLLSARVRVLLERWEPERLERFLDVGEPEQAADTLVEHFDMAPAEIEEWVRRPFRGDIHRLHGSTMMHLWRDMIRDGTAAAQAAASLGLLGRSAVLTYQPSSSPPDLPFPSEARREARDNLGLRGPTSYFNPGDNFDPHPGLSSHDGFGPGGDFSSHRGFDPGDAFGSHGGLGPGGDFGSHRGLGPGGDFGPGSDFGLGGDEMNLLDPMGGLPAPAFAALARFRLAGWPSDEAVLTALPTEPGRPLSATLPEFARVACLSAAEIHHWRAMLTEVGPGPLPLAEIWRLCGPALTWRSIGLPPDLAPWCAAAHLPPAEALAMHQAGTLDVAGLRALALLTW
ncbi:hypothetical protein [Actinoplanes sp. HUAS TT8]|uniref:hypothetical protein n=1 Tax=Actinoplanes sp. HUAS TT8 TaxID=3447453 RepID=UPI003F5208C3